MNPVAKKASERLAALGLANHPGEMMTVPTADVIVVLLELQKLDDEIRDFIGRKLDEDDHG